MKIQIGTWSTGGAAAFDLTILRRNKLLMQANSGGGKSYGLRRIAEQAYGHIPTIVIDPEGEFATLREKFDFVLVGKGGETPADVRSAALVARRLLELRVSAVCDLYEMRPTDRHAWVRAFFEAMIDAPKTLWHDTLVLLDEAHVFAPQQGAGESEAKDAVVAMATRGRKRGFGLVAATQRLGKFDKNVAAEIGNVLIGHTFVDIDQERAADALGVPRGERTEFCKQLRLLEPGNFYALGRAITLERRLLRIGPVQTTHPDTDNKRTRSAAPPPPTAKIRHLLPKLADLPKEAEEKAATEVDLRRRVAELMRELRAAKTAEPRVLAPSPTRAPAEPKRVEVAVLDKAAVARLERAVEKLDKMRDATAQAQQTVVSTVGVLSTTLRQAMNHAALRPGGTAIKAPPAPIVQAGRWDSVRPTSAVGTYSDLPEGQRRVLTALAQFQDAQPRKKIAILAGYAPAGSTMRAILAGLRKHGFVFDQPGDILSVTPDGMTALGPFTPLPTGEALLKHWLGELAECPAKLLGFLADAYPAALGKQALEDMSAGNGTRYVAGGSTMRAGLARLRALDLVVDVGNEIKASPELME